MLFFNKNKGPVVGLDISSSSVKVMEFSQTSKGYRVDHFGVGPLPSNAVTEKVISDVDAVGESIRQVMKKSSSKAKNCCLAVAGSAVITKVITMPANLSEEDLEGQIQQF